MIFTRSCVSMAAVLLLLFLPVCPSLATEDKPVAKSASALSLSTIKNGTYKVESHSGMIKLKNGEAEGDFPGGAIAGGWLCKIEQVALGDVDGDGKGDAVIVIGYNGGGSGYFVNLVAVLNKNGHPVQGASYDLGDRVIVKDLRLSKQRVTLVMLDHGDSDGLASASLKKSLSFRLVEKRWQVKSLK
ncbi:MAG: hypothetical protein WC028_27065 [Candidatus Obscuribacterales bacterium]